MKILKAMSVAAPLSLVCLISALGAFPTLASADSDLFSRGALGMHIKSIMVSALSSNGFDIEVDYEPSEYYELAVGLSYSSDAPTTRTLPNGTEVIDRPYSEVSCATSPAGPIPVTGSGYIKFHVAASGDCLTSHLSSTFVTVILGGQSESYPLTSAGTRVTY